MDILSYLTDLLKTQKEVGIEGLGTFFKKKVPGRYDVENHLFIPPSYTLNFTTEVRDTAELISYISSARNISGDSAQYYIGLFAEDINRQIATSNQADLDSLGILTNVEDHLTLTKQGDPNLGFEFYGLPQISTIKEDQPIETPVEEPESEIVGLTESEPGESETQDSENVESEPEESTLESVTSEEENLEGTTTEELTEKENTVEDDLAQSAEEQDFDDRDDQEVYDEISENQPIITPVSRIEIETSEDLIEEEEEYEEARLNTQEVELLREEVELSPEEVEQTLEDVEPSSEDVEFSPEQAEASQTQYTDSNEQNNETANNEELQPIIQDDSEPKGKFEGPVDTIVDQQLEVPDSFVAGQENVAIPGPETGPAVVSDSGTANIWHFDRERSTSASAKSSGETTANESPANSDWIKYVIIGLVILIILGGIAYFLKPQWYGIEQKAIATTPKDTAIIAPIPVKTDSVMIDSSSDVVKSSAIDTASIVPAAAAAIEATDSVTWEIIGASLTKKEVDQYVKDMKAKGYAAKPVPNMPGKRRIKMSIATFKDEESAKEGRRLLVKKLNNNDLYIFQNKNTQKPL